MMKYRKISREHILLLDTTPECVKYVVLDIQVLDTLFYMQCIGKFLWFKFLLLC